MQNSNLSKFTLKNVVVIVIITIINVIVDHIFSCPTATSDARGASDRLCLHEQGKERKREGDSERVRERAKERGRERNSKGESERTKETKERAIDERAR